MTETSTFAILKNFPSEAARILKLSKKPTRSEYDDVAKITGIGIILLGAIGLMFLLIRVFLEGKFG